MQKHAKNAATAATQARLCSFQCFFWHGFPQYQARWHCEQHIILTPSDWQWKQRWVSSGGAAPLPFLPVLPLACLVGFELLLLLALAAVAAAEASVGGLLPCDAASDASDAARAPSAVFGGMVHTHDSARAPVLHQVLCCTHSVGLLRNWSPKFFQHGSTD